MNDNDIDREIMNEKIQEGQIAIKEASFPNPPTMAQIERMEAISRRIRAMEFSPHGYIKDWHRQNIAIAEAAVGKIKTVRTTGTKYDAMRIIGAYFERRDLIQFIKKII
jgi:hypothetical protein